MVTDSQKKETNRLHIIYITLFILILLVPGVTMLIPNTHEADTGEKRTLSTLPEFTNTKSFTTSIEHYFNDHFGFRSTLISVSNFIRIHLFKSTPKPEHNQFGKDGYLFFTKKDDEIFESFTHQDLMSDTQLANGLRKQEFIRDSLQHLGIKYELAFWPNKHTIYKEKLPESLYKQIPDTISLVDQVTSYFKANHFNITDVRDALFKAKEKEQLYYKLDSHWNSNGAYIAYKTFCEQTFSRLGLIPFKSSDFKITEKQSLSGDLIDIMGVKETYIFSDLVPKYNLIDTTKSYKRIYPEGITFPTVVTENLNAPQQKTLLVFRDSYSTALVQFFSLHYKKVIYIWTNPTNLGIVNRFKPDVVISSSVERYIPYSM